MHVHKALETEKEAVQEAPPPWPVKRSSSLVIVMRRSCRFVLGRVLVETSTIRVSTNTATARTKLTIFISSVSQSVVITSSWRPCFTRMYRSKLRRLHFHVDALGPCAPWPCSVVAVRRVLTCVMLVHGQGPPRRHGDVQPLPVRRVRDTEQPGPYPP